MATAHRGGGTEDVSEGGEIHKRRGEEWNWERRKWQWADWRPLFDFLYINSPIYGQITTVMDSF